MKKQIAALAFAATALVGTALGAPQGRPDSGVRVKVADIMDPTGFERPMRAASSLVPSDWKVTGGVFYKMGGDCTSGQNISWRASSPDGKASIEMLPNVGWSQNNQGYPTGRDCLNAGFGSADQFVRAWAGSLPGGRVVEVVRDPATQRMLAPMTFEMGGDPYTKSWGDYVTAQVDYTANGRAMKAIVSVFTYHSYMKSGYTYAIGSALEMQTGGASLITVYSAPADVFESYLPLFHLFSANYRVDPQWQAKVNAVRRQGNADAARAAAERSKIISDTYSDISDMSMDSWRKRQDSDDYLRREQGEAIRGAETYSADTPTGQIELPYGYESAWQLNDGSFVVTEDNFYDPYRDSGQEGRRLTPLE